MRISCIFAPTSETPAHIEVAESLGYHCAYSYDSPAIGPDVYVTLALAAQRTRTIRLGTGMMIPRLRHVVTTAAAHATLDRLAPGRIVMGVGSGFTGSRLLGQRAMRWQDIKDFVVAVRTLLRGEEIEWDGALVSLVPSPDFARSLPLELPVIVAADGPRGRQTARDLGAGLCMGAFEPQDGFDWLATQARTASTSCPAAGSGGSASSASPRSAGTSRCTAAMGTSPTRSTPSPSRGA